MIFARLWPLLTGKPKLSQIPCSQFLMKYSYNSSHCAATFPKVSSFGKWWELIAHCSTQKKSTLMCTPLRHIYRQHRRTCCYRLQIKQLRKSMGDSEHRYEKCRDISLCVPHICCVHGHGKHAVSITESVVGDNFLGKTDPPCTPSNWLI